MSGVVTKVVAPNVRAAVARRLMQGKASLRGIAREHDVSHEYVRLVRVSMERNGMSVPRPRPGTRFSPAVDVAELRRQIKMGKTRLQVAEALRVSPRTISRLKKEHGIDGLHGRVGRPLSHVDCAMIALAYEGGKGLRALSEDYRIGMKRVRQILEDANVRIRPRGGNHP